MKYDTCNYDITIYILLLVILVDCSVQNLYMKCSGQCSGLHNHIHQPLVERLKVDDDSPYRSAGLSLLD